ncbi:hypothetical protein SNOG_02861 [Parastagonospora nodorum SN15]|uniref:Homeobox domain-containing protein n=1 Tax=Phaeosphaeria nodorum (strain SN15 / ATCC MYA-4574 / FGSC 10173) TaxID=321614 RepID=Q0UZF3_PHANO|nr:hypothetical protein SNOG_02861 [Parastagonospora nodorum SN15]EAT89592.2 hypothetical protein SNOG_02861 [Parastagonospora nodorum SN15]
MASSQYTERRMGSLAAESTTEPPSSFPTAWHPSHHPLPSDGTNSTLRRFSEEGKHTYLKLREQNTYHENAILDTFLMNLQNPNSRSSPPIQPNERGYADKLPSFSEFLDTTRADHTPPHTPSRRQGSHDESPGGARLQFDDILWQDKGHRRIDTLGDIYAQTGRANGSDAHPQDHRRMSSVADPTLTRRYENGYGEVRFQQHVGADPNNFNRKRRGNLPKESTNMLKQWFSQHRSQPYPTEDQKIELCNITGLTMNQCLTTKTTCASVTSALDRCCCLSSIGVNYCHMYIANNQKVSNWFINARRRAPQKEAREREANGGRGTEER